MRRADVRAETACLSNSRAGLLARLRELGRAVTVEELAEFSGQHRNTVRRHLEELVATGLVVSELARPQGRGRPPVRYEVNRRALDGETEYAHLAALLARHLTESGDAAAATVLGEQWADQLIDQARRRGDDQPAALDLLEELGFAPKVAADGHQVSLRRCPLLQAATAAPDVVCVMHATMVRKLLTEQGVDASESEVRPFVGPHECVLTVAPGAVPAS